MFVYFFSNMSTYLSIINIVILSIIPLAVHSQNPVEVLDFGENDGNLRMLIHVPDSLYGKQVPLVVVLHGCYENAEKTAEQTGWSELANKNNFIVIYPEQKVVNNISSCFNWFNANDIHPKKGESSSILEMIRFTRQNYNIDSTRVFIYGLSAGAAMTINLMGNAPTTFNSGASLAGGPYGMATNAFQAARAMMNPRIKSAKEWGDLLPKSPSGTFPKLIVIHGTNDNTVDFKNSNELIKQWTYIHNIEFQNQSSIADFEGNQIVERTQFPSDTVISSVIFYKLNGIGHALPVDPGTDENQGGATGMFAVDCDFFSTYYIAKDFGLIND